MSAANKTLLEHRLAELLGISIDDDHDYVTDVFNSLIEIGECPDDVIEYLTNFGGDGDLHQFAIDLQKHKLGEDISTIAEVVDDTKQPAASNTITKPKVVLDEAAAQRREIEAREKRRREVEAIAAQKRIEDDMAKQQQQRRRKEEEAEAKKKRQLEMEKKKSANTSTTPQENKESGNSLKPIKSKTKSSSTKAAIAKKQTPKIQTKKQQTKPQKGKPLNKLCGCYGSKHKPLTNCLHCGRISCEVEGFDYCHFCGYIIQDFSSTETGDRENNIDSAIRHKERLLEFDRTSASRTHVHDDQEDYFVTSSNMWATSEEQDDARDMEEKRRQKLHTRQKQRLDIKF